MRGEKETLRARRGGGRLRNEGACCYCQAGFWGSKVRSAFTSGQRDECWRVKEEKTQKYTQPISDDIWRLETKTKRRKWRNELRGRYITTDEQQKHILIHATRLNSGPHPFLKVVPSEERLRQKRRRDQHHRRRLKMKIQTFQKKFLVTSCGTFTFSWTRR